MEKMVHSSFFLTLKRYFLLITQIVVSFLTILEGQNDGYATRSKAWNDVFWKLTIALMIFEFIEANKRISKKRKPKRQNWTRNGKAW
ncbi:hypothetical protein Tco_0814700 [Tanacetum coccineum]